jgi:hypothetical protein
MNKLHDDILTSRSMIERGKITDAANFLCQQGGSDTRVKDVDEATLAVTSLYHALIENGDWTGAALLRWGKTLFNPDPHSVQLIWKHLCDPTKNKVLIMGCGSSGKTYSTSGWAVLNWSRDPQYTSGKIVSTTAGHAKSNIMSRIKTFHQNSIIPFPGEPEAPGIIYPGLDKSASIMSIAIPEGETGEGRLTGFHPYPRPEPHPIFGVLSRGFVVIDEADVVAEGLWAGVDNMLSNEDFTGSIKVVALTNPRLKQNSFAFRAEPEGGWAALDEDAEEWISREGWQVISLDAAKSENVISKKTIFPGLMTYQGYMNYVRKGKSDPNYWTYARGKYPPDSTASYNVFSLQSFDNSIGRLMFVGDVTTCASIDPAFADGGDDAIMTIGRFGNAIGFTDEKEIYHKFPKVKKALQVEQQIVLLKGRAHEMGDQIIKILRAYGVRPEWVVMDKTGNGRGLWDYLCWQYGEVTGIEWGSKATETKILREDKEVAAERYRGIAAEMWFAASQWLDFGYIKFSPTMDGFYKLRDECTLRRWKFSQTLQQLEDKATFKAENKGRSCDKSDSFVMLPNIIRKNSQGLPMILADNPANALRPLVQDKSVVDAPIDWLPDDKLA